MKTKTLTKMRIAHKTLISSLFVATLTTSCQTRDYRSQTSSSVAEPATQVSQQELVNYNSSVKCNTSMYWEAKNTEQVQGAIQKALRNSLNIRVISQKAPHSYSPVICPAEGGIVLNVAPMNAILSTDLLSEIKTVTVQPGVILADLQEHLNKLGMAFPVSPDYNDLTLAGAMATGAHNSSLRIPSAVGDWLESLTFVNGKGEIQKLEGQALDTARVNLGLMGAMVEMKLRIEPQFKLKYQSIKKEDSKLGQELEELVRKHDYARVNWYPAQSQYVLEAFDKVPMITNGDSYSTSWTSTPDLSVLGELPTKILNASKFASCSAEFMRVNLVPGFIKAQNSPAQAPVGLSHRMLSGNCRDKKCPWQMNLKARTVEFAFPVSEFNNWVQDVRKVLAERQACFVNGIYIRFSKASNAALGQAYGYDAAIVEIHIPTLKEPALEKWSEVYEEILQMSLAKFNARPHWGKNSAPYFKGLGSKQYPAFNEFEKFRTENDPAGIFVGPMWKTVKLEGQARESFGQKAGCAVTRECICSTDEHCGSGAKCVPGGYFTQAKVCKK